MRDLFLSYARKDLGEIEVLSGDLRGLGYSPWYDIDLTGGIEWWSRILERIRTADVFLFAVSGSSVESQACLTEYRYAKALRRTILPLHVADNVRLSTLPVEVASLQLLDYRAADKKSAISLSRTLLELPPTPALPDPLPEEPRQPMSYLAELREQIDSRDINFDGQAGLVVKIRTLLREPASREEALELAVRLQKRRDVFQQVYKDLEDLIMGSAAAAQAKDRLAEQPTTRQSSQKPDAPPAAQPPSMERRTRVSPAPVIPQPPTPNSNDATATASPLSDPFLTSLARSFHRQGYKAMREKYADEQIMSMLGIGYDGRAYMFRSYRYERIADAVNYALKALHASAGEA